MHRVRIRRHNVVWLVLIASVLLLCSRSVLRAQETWIGVAADMAYQRHTTLIPVFSLSSAACGVFENGWETPFALGGQISFAPGPDRRLGLSGRIMLSPSSGLLATVAPESFAFYDEVEDSTVVRRAAHEYRLKTKMRSLRLDLLLDYAITDRLVMQLGPSFGYLLSLAVHQSDYITDGTYRFEGGVREQEMTRQDVLATQTLLIGGQVGISYRMPITQSLIFVPEVLVRTDFTPLFQQAGRFMVGPGIGFSLLARISGGLRERDTVVNDIPPPDTTSPPPLRASITLRGADDLGRPLPWARVRIYETMRRNRAEKTWHIEHRTAPPTLSVEPDFASINGISEWRVLFRYKGEVIGSSSSRDDSPPTSMSWNIPDDPETDTGNTLSVELTVTDSAGAVVTATDRIPLRIERLARIVDDRGDSILYTLYPVAEESAEDIRENNRALREAAQRAEEGGSIEIIRLVEEKGFDPSADSTERTKAGREAAAIADRLKNLLEQEEGKRIPITTAVQAVAPITYRTETMPQERSIYPAIQIVVKPPR